MSAHTKTLLPLLAGGVLLAFSSVGTTAAACDKGCKPPPPPCCHPPKPPAPPKPNQPQPGNFNVNVNVHANATAVSTANATANANSNSGSSGDTFFFGGGGANIIATPGFPVIQRLNVLGETARRAVVERRSVFKQMIVQASCIDERGRPHPASRLTPDQEVGEGFKGELFRCIAGTKLQATFAEYMGKVSFDGGQVLACNKGDALWHENGTIVCRPQTAQRNCFERSLLRRHGVGVKIFRMSKVEEFTSFQEEVQTAQGEIALDGGVGGFVH
jgi:hypothetical protein